MITPNSTAVEFIDWLLTLNHWRYTPHGKNIMQLVRDKAIAGEEISMIDYNIYNAYTGWRWSVYIQSITLGTLV